MQPKLPCNKIQKDFFHPKIWNKKIIMKSELNVPKKYNSCQMNRKIKSKLLGIPRN